MPNKVQAVLRLILINTKTRSVNGWNSLVIVGKWQKEGSSPPVCTAVGGGTHKWVSWLGAICMCSAAKLREWCLISGQLIWWLTMWGTVWGTVLGLLSTTHTVNDV